MAPRVSELKAVPLITIPPSFAAGIVTQAGDAGRAWIERLPALVASLCERWGLDVDGTPMHGYLGLVVPVTRGAEPCALKVSWIEESTIYEIAALAAWDGRGMVRLLEADPELGAMLLERLDYRRSLEQVEIGEAISIAGHLVRRLSVPLPEKWDEDARHRSSLPVSGRQDRDPGRRVSAPASESRDEGEVSQERLVHPSVRSSGNVPLLQDVAERLVDSVLERWERLGRPFSASIIDAARGFAAELGPTAGSLLVNTDLHYGNVLAGQREPWLAIDPKVVIGDPEFGLAQLLWTRLEDLEGAGGLSRHVDALVDRAGLDPSRAHAWTLVRCVDYWLWGLGIGLTDDPARCEVLVRWAIMTIAGRG